MKYIRNFIYNFSDIFIALLIIALAALLIWSRVGIIMDYPDSYDGNTITAKIANAIPFIPDIQNPGSNAAVKDSSEGTPENGTAGDGTQASAEVQTPEVVDSNQLKIDLNTGYIEVTIPQGSTIDNVGSILQQYGIVVDINDFTYQVMNMGLDGKLLPGTFYIPQGCTMEQVVNILAGVITVDTSAISQNQ